MDLTASGKLPLRLRGQVARRLTATLAQLRNPGVSVQEVVRGVEREVVFREVVTAERALLDDIDEDGSDAARPATVVR